MRNFWQKEADKHWKRVLELNREIGGLNCKLRTSNLNLKIDLKESDR